jgi:membrane-associated protease RseP (regulator of RpoE activity)
VAFSTDGDHVLAVGRGSGPTKEDALAVARNDALAEIMGHMLEALAGTATFDLLKARGAGERRAATAELEASRYLQQVGAFATPERVEARFQEQDGAVTAVARYRLRKEDYDAAVQFYRRTATLSGLTAAPIFPALERKIRTKGDLVVVALEDKSPAAAAGIHLGDVVLTVNGRSAPGLEAFESAAQKPSDSGLVEVELESGNARRTVKIPRTAGKR